MKGIGCSLSQHHEACGVVMSVFKRWMWFRCSEQLLANFKVTVKNANSYFIAFYYTEGDRCCCSII